MLHSLCLLYACPLWRAALPSARYSRRREARSAFTAERFTACTRAPTPGMGCGRSKQEEDIDDPAESSPRQKCKSAPAPAPASAEPGDLVGLDVVLSGVAGREELEGCAAECVMYDDLDNIYTVVLGDVHFDGTELPWLSGQRVLLPPENLLRTATERRKGPGSGGGTWWPT